MLINAAKKQLLDLCHIFKILPPELRFDLNGKCAGLAYWPQNYIRINLTLFMEHPEAFLKEVIPHELCHIWKNQLNLPGRPHGRSWKELMCKMGVTATRTHNFPIDHLITKQFKQFPYICSCREYLLSSIRHNRVLAGRKYLCRNCKTHLKLKKEANNLLKF
ncbi:MAG: SprT-like domain-containing protein [Proteobacteria bacterium]|nr:SprT-like domain-containing protein [Pseudomonadota bacterium]MDE3207349.1 SprT-like domain-containing protein [Pseudomonadota bacterium]